MSVSIVPQEFAVRPGLLDGRVVLVTGASGGLGGALALDCARAGATVILSGRNRRKLEETYDRITAVPAPTPALAPLDLATATAADYDALAATIEKEFGRLDGLVHSAAMLGDRSPLEMLDVPTWCRTLHVNLTAPFILNQVLLPNLRRSPDGSVILVSSGVVRRPRPFWGAYAVSKAGLEMVREMFAEELAGISAVRVNSVNPGAMRTAMRMSAYPGEDPSRNPSPAEVTRVFLYLLSRDSQGVSGGYFEAQ
ncbi:MAG: YciK family oxidoreductase [Gammaproteobacteria bacterium]|nr:YciK family oxidoreductase [Gammaproteobacteria bacterium]